MILIESSVWVHSFSSSPGRARSELRRMIAESEPFALAGVVVAEVLQGLTRDAVRIEITYSSSSREDLRPIAKQPRFTGQFVREVLRSRPSIP